MTRPIIETAKAYRNAGLSVIPIAHGDKRPACNWKRYERELIDDATLELRYAAQFGGHLPDRVGVIAGDISGGLEMIDFDAGGADYDVWAAQVIEDAPGLLERLVIERTPTGGYHVAYRCANVEHSRKLAFRWFADAEKAGWKTTIETRGEGGYCVVAPSDGYELFQGDWLEVPYISATDRDILIDAACSLNDKPAKQPPGVVLRQATGMINDDFRLYRAQCYLDAMPESIDKQGGHPALFNAVTAMMYGFDLSEEETRQLIVAEFNPRCQPPWTEKEIDHKIAEAIKKPPKNPRGWLLQQSQPGDMIDISGLLATIEPRRTQEKRFNILSCPALMRADLTFNFLIDNVLVEGQPCIVGGPVKCMKTSLLLDMAVALASGSAFLGRFPVKEACKVLVMSGESGLLTIRDTIRRISETGTVDTATLDNLLICDRLPRLDDPESIIELIEALKQYEPRVVIYDPAYWMINGDDAGNVMKMGRQLIALAQLCHGCGTTMILAHHFRKASSGVGKVPELNDLSQAGFSEFARQWLLVNRQEAYDNTGVHKLFVTIGGSIGHGGLYDVEIDEGEFPNRIWGATVADIDPAAQKRKKEQDAEEFRKSRVRGGLVDHPDGLMLKALVKSIGMNPNTLKETLQKMIDAGEVELIETTGGNGRLTTLFKLLAAQGVNEFVESLDDDPENDWHAGDQDNDE